MIKILDDLRREINLQEAVTDKIIMADAMREKAKILPIRDNYKELFEVEEKEQTLEEQRRIFRGF